MTLPASPPISISQILTELGRGPTGTLSGAADERSLSGVASGPISFSNYLGKSSVTPGQQNFFASGTFVVPTYTTLTVVCYGSGGGEGGSLVDSGAPECNIGGGGTAGGTGGQARFLFGTNPTANGGGGGAGYTIGSGSDGAAGTPGSGSGGTVVVGGGAAGGDGSTCNSTTNNSTGGAGGAGGRVTKVFTNGVDGPTVGANISVTIGNGGAAGQGSCGSACGLNGTPPHTGVKGQVIISWS